ncbi:universal stress protein [Aridibaculum aurantiacum]|uniref:universal stress protein n=1 Tax=Aridibaculum aurantiacum TaxID=2810307 RepID=UPI001A971816|nr:universal stress protein [Aridibaculum aurantiacum]
MQGGFKKILIPVHWSLLHKVAVQRALEWADATASQIILAEMHDPFFDIKAKLFKWQQPEVRKYETGLKNSNTTFSTSYSKYYTTAEAIANKAREDKADLVVIPENKFWWPSTSNGFLERIASAAGVPVLKVKTKATRTTSVVVPVQHDVQGNLLEQVSAISRRNPVDVHLVSFNENKDTEQDDFAPLGALQAYQWLKSYVRCPVAFSRVKGASEAKAVNNYLHHLQSDVLLLQ